jgi:hypothetical protein
MTPEQLQQFLDQLAAKLTPAGSHVLELAVRTQIIYGVMFCTIGTVLVIIGTFGFYKTIRHLIEIWYDDNITDANAIATTVCAIAFPFVTVFGFAFFFGNLPNLLNPEWYAIKDILSSLR